MGNGLGLGNIASAVGRANPNQGQTADIIEFIGSTWGLNIRLYPVQQVILKAHYGLELDDTTKFAVAKDWHQQDFWQFTEKEYLAFLFNEGRCNIKEVDHERREMVLCVGRRSGKTFISAGIASYETYKLLLRGSPQKYYGLASGSQIGIVSVATDKEQAGILYSEASEHFRECGFFAPYTANNTMSYARFQSPEDITQSCRYDLDPQRAKVTLKVSFRSCIAKGLRGPGNIIIILDELAHFTDGTQQSSAEAVYNAITPSTATFSPKDPNDNRKPTGPVEGRIISISSPLGRQGHFYKMFGLAMKGGTAGDDMLAIQAPTWEVNPTLPTSEYAKNYAKGPTVFFTEFGAQFTDRTRGWIERETDLTTCIDPNRRPLIQAPARRPHFVGIDVGLVNDGSALAIGHIEPIDGSQKIVLDYLDYIRAGQGDFAGADRLEFDDVVAWIHRMSRKFFFTEGMFDMWAGIPFEQALAKKGLRQLKAEHLTANLNSDMFRNFKDMMFDQRLVLYDWPLPEGEGTQHCPYITELLELQAEVKSKYVTVVQAPQVEDKHDDMSDALIRMVWKASQHLGNAKYIAGTKGAPPLAGGISPAARTQARQKAIVRSRQMGTSPDRQRSPYNKGAVRGRRG